MHADVAGLVLVEDCGTSELSVETREDFVANGLGSEVSKVKFIVWLQNIDERLWPMKTACRKLEGHGPVESDDDDALALLRYSEIEPIQNFVVDVITVRAKSVEDDLECPSTVVAGQLFDVLEEKYTRVLRLDDAVDVEELGAARVLKTLASADDAESLAGEAGVEDIEVGNVFIVDFGDVAGEAASVEKLRVKRSEVCLVGFPGGLVPLTCEHAFRTEPGECKVKTADAGKQIDERERLAPCDLQMWGSIPDDV